MKPSNILKFILLPLLLLDFLTICLCLCLNSDTICNDILHVSLFSYFIVLCSANIILCISIGMILLDFICSVQEHHEYINWKSKHPSLVHSQYPNIDIKTIVFPYVHKYKSGSSNYFTYMIYIINVLIFIVGEFVMVGNSKCVMNQYLFTLCVFNWIVIFLFLYFVLMCRNKISGSIIHKPSVLECDF